MTPPLQAISNFLSATFSRVFVALSWIRIEEQSSDRLLLNANGCRTVADARARPISMQGKAIAGFDDIESIDVKHFVNGKRAEWLVVTLSLADHRSVRIGGAADDVQASVAAAALSTITGRRVKVLQGWAI